MTFYGRDHVLSGVKQTIYYLNSHVIVLLENLLECFSINNFSGMKEDGFQCELACNL